MSFSGACVSGRELAERFATCPPVGCATLRLYLRKALGQLTPADRVARVDLKPRCGLSQHTITPNLNVI